MWGALLGSLISGGLQMYGNSQAQDTAQESSLFQLMLMNKAGKNLQKDYQSVINDIASNPAGYAGTRVKPAEYNPVDISESQRSSVQGNLDNFDLINQLVGRTNSATTQNDISRILNFDPRALSTLDNLSSQANAWSSGRLPQDAIQDIISNASSRSAAYGTPGGAAPATLRDLGLNSMDAVQRGSSLFSQIMQQAESISPVSRQIAAPQFYITPQQGLQTDLQQALLNQQSQQNANNLNAAPDPALNLMAQLRLQAANSRAQLTAGSASLVQPNLTNYGSMYGQLGNSISQALTGAFGGSGSFGTSFGGGGGFSSGFGASGGFDPAAWNAQAIGYNQNLSGNTPPKAYAVY